jgi:endonuclease/exonuclease/phosphatase family metal-dependent hydrolase
VVTIASYNTHFGVDRHGVPFDVIAAIADLDADVVALQEVWRPHGGRSFAADAAEQLGYEVHETPLAPGLITHRQDLAKRDEQSEGMWGLAVLSRAPSRARPTIPLGRIAFDRAARVAMPVEVDTGDPGGPLVVVVTHISHRLFGSPRQIRRVVRAIDPDGEPTVVLGDFNLWGPPVGLLFGDGWTRPVRGRTWPAWRPHSQLDHIVCNRAVAARDGQVVAQTPSDHRPVRATVDVAVRGGRRPPATPAT